MAGQDQDVIKEFLVALGFKIDESSFKKFTGGVEGVTKDVFKLGLVITGAVAATDIFVTKLAEGMDKLYFSSKRTGATIQEMNSFQFAVKQLGGTAEEAMSAMEALASFRLKYGPAADAQLVGFGVKPQDVNDSKKSLDDLSDSWQKLAKEQGSIGRSVGLQQAQSLGISENTFRAMLDPRFREEEAKRESLLKDMGVNTEEAAKQARQYIESVDQINTAWGQIGTTMMTHLLPAMQAFSDISLKIARDLPAMLEKVGDQLLRIKNGDNTTYGDQKISKFDEILGGIIGIFNKDAGMDWIDAAASTGKQIDKNKSERLLRENSGTVQSSIDFWLSKGYSREQAAGIAANEQRESGGKPTAHNTANGEDSYGLYQWSVKRRAAILKNFGIDVNKGDANDQREAASLELDKSGLSAILKRVNSAGEAAALFSKKFERPANGDYEANLRASMAGNLVSNDAQARINNPAGNTSKEANMTQTNNIQVTAPSADGEAIAGAITRGQYGQAANFLRFMKGAV